MIPSIFRLNFRVRSFHKEKSATTEPFYASKIQDLKLNIFASSSPNDHYNITVNFPQKIEENAISRLVYLNA